MRKSIVAVTATCLMTILLIIMSGCTGYPRESAALDNYKDTVALTKDYVYMWQRDGLYSSKRTVNVQTPKYAIQIDALRGKMTALGHYASRSKEDKYTECDFGTLGKIKSNFYVTENGKTRKGSNKKRSMRIIESGRNMQKTDYINISYGGGRFSDFTGRVEYAAQQNHFSINYEIYSQRSCTLNLAFEIEFAGMTATSLHNQAGIVVINRNGEGFAILPHDEKTVKITANKSTVTFGMDVAMTAEKHSGLGILFIPITKDNHDNLADFNAAKTAQVVAYDKSSDNPLPVLYDAKRGVHMVDVSDINVGDLKLSENHNNYERVGFRIVNSTASPSHVSACFVKDVGADFSVTGMSPMLRDNNTLEPTGEQVQISKNWHSHASSVADNAMIRIGEGMWYKGYVTLHVDSATTLEREYLCAYAKWGNAYAASHSQLSLIGWGGNQIWDQSAIGSWGESVTYDPDRGLERSFINDVRPFCVTAPTGGNQPYDWSGNVGGADFLVYKAGLKNIYLIDNKIEYITQAPNLTQVKYSGITSDGKIATEIFVQLGRTDDIVRNTYTLKYTFLEDVSYSRLALFKMGADKYADNYYTKYAYGDESGAIMQDEDTITKSGYQSKKVVDALNDNFWFAQYASTSEDEHADSLMTIRHFQANINNRQYSRAGYRLHGTKDYKIPQSSCEITLPNACGKKISKNSTVHMVVEYSILPAKADTYYGDCDYLLAQKSDIGTVKSLYNQVKNNTIHTDVRIGNDNTVGSIVNINVDNRSPVVAEFSLQGGLGFTPVIFNGLAGYSGYRLEKYENGAWQAIKQSVLGNDYWQTHYDTNTQTYQLVFNVKNSSGTQFMQTNAYRLIKVQ